MPLHTLKDLFVQELRDIHDAENQLLVALPSFAARAANDELRLALEEHHELTKGHLARLDRIFEKLRLPSEDGACIGMKGLIKAAEKLLAQEADEVIRDASVITAAQKIAHYEISAYGSLRAFADTLGIDEFAWILTETLEDEREADQRLTRLAELLINAEAAHTS